MSRAFPLIRRDVQRYFALEAEGRGAPALQKLRILVDSPGLHAVLIYRFGSWINRRVPFRLLRLPLQLVYVILDRLCVVAWGIHIDAGAEIGGGLYIGHPGGVLIGPAHIGQDCNVAHQVSIGRRADGTGGLPTIGNRVWIGTGSVVFGDIHIGDGVTIGPLTVVSRSLPPRMLVMGNPMRVLRANYNNNPEIYGAHGPPQTTAINAAAPAWSKRRCMAAALHGSGAATLVRRVRRWRGEEIRILAYHRILDIGEAGTFEFDSGLVSASTEDFEWQMRHVRDVYTPITFRDFVAFVDRGVPLPPRPLIVTFDDGFDDNYRHAFPILRASGVPATFFVSTGYIGQHQTFWFDWFFYLCQHAVERRQAPVIGNLAFSPTPDNAEAQARRALSTLWTLADDERRLAIARLEESLGMKQPDEGFVHSRPLNWEQVTAMAAGGMEFGSHTVSHPILSKINQAELRYELAQSKHILEERLACPIDALAYPVGAEFAFNDAITQATRDAGYRVAVSYVAGANYLQQLDRFKLKRLHVERDLSRAEFAAALAAPALFG